jgi:hypothetical protein
VLTTPPSISGPKSFSNHVILVLMVCRNICERLYSKIIVGKGPYQAGKKCCRRCEVCFYQVDRFCQCCGMTLRTSPAGKN